MTDKHAIFLSGPIGVGKTTLGRVLAQSLGGAFIDGDDHGDPRRPWYCSILRTSAGIVGESLTLLEANAVVVVAYPLGCKTWIYFRRNFEARGVCALFVSLRATFDSIVDERRGREFDQGERDRIQVMIAEGDGARSFSDLIVDTDQVGFDATAVHLMSQTRALMQRTGYPCPAPCVT